jgi:predicted glutamine amidotransferase
MCRWIAYAGPELSLSDLLLRPEHSFIQQSFHAWKSSYAVNGDGVGVGWYGGGSTPGLYRETRPAWNDENLRSLAQHVRSGMFLAHVRATSGSAIQRSNCHPFRHGRWLFQHNGEISGYRGLRRDLDLAIAPELYAHMEGSADSERLFYLALTQGVDRDVPAALTAMVKAVEAAGQRHGHPRPLKMTAAISDGRRLFALRYSSDGDSPSLFYSRHPHALRTRSGRDELLPDGGVIVLSEPLDEVSEHWSEVPEGTLLEIEEGEVREQSFG